MDDKEVVVKMFRSDCDTPFGEIRFFKGSGILKCDASYMVQKVIYEDIFFSDVHCSVTEE